MPMLDSQRAVCAILAAGASSRMGCPKALLEVGGATLLERALAAAGDLRVALVTSTEVAARARVPAHVIVILNDAPQRGMAHSLALANAALGRADAALVVLLADTPLVDHPLVVRILAARGAADVVYPVRAGIAGHPVVFGPLPRTAIGALPAGDSLRNLRSDTRWSRVEVPFSDDAPFVDVDRPEDLAAVAHRLGTTS